MTYKNITTKEMRLGWKTETKIKLGDAEDFNGNPAERFLIFSTCKRYSGISTNASVVLINERGERSFTIPDDYSKTVMTFPKKRATESGIKDCHKAASLKFADHIADATAQYAQA